MSFFVSHKPLSIVLSRRPEYPYISTVFLFIVLTPSLHVSDPDKTKDTNVTVATVSALCCLSGYKQLHPTSVSWKNVQITESPAVDITMRLNIIKMLCKHSKLT